MADTNGLQLLDLAALGTIGGQVLATTAVTNGLARAFNWQPRWLGLVVALICCLALAYLTNLTSGLDWFLAVLNAFVVYLAAAGTSSAGAAVVSGPASDKREMPGQFENIPNTHGFFRPWF
jgi:hypothetical protein